MLTVIDNFIDDVHANVFADEAENQLLWKPSWNEDLADGWLWHAPLDIDRQNPLGTTQYIDVDSLEAHQRALWEAASYAIHELTGVVHKPQRFYTNSHTFGQDGYIHTDDGDVTILYYPCKDWAIEWEGGTSFYNEDVTDCIGYAAYKFNRAVIFDAKIPHRAMPVTRSCYKLRSSVVFKSSMDTDHPTYEQWFNARY